MLLSLFHSHWSHLVCCHVYFSRLRVIAELRHGDLFHSANIVSRCVVCEFLICGLNVTSSRTSAVTWIDKFMFWSSDFKYLCLHYKL
jgi:hypothetical protein